MLNFSTGCWKNTTVKNGDLNPGGFFGALASPAGDLSDIRVFAEELDIPYQQLRNQLIEEDKWFNKKEKKSSK